MKTASSRLLLAGMCVLLVTCSQKQTFTLGGTTAGLAGSGLTLSSPGEVSDQIAVGSTSFQFYPPLSFGSAYDVEVTSQPQAPPQTCSVARGIGTIVANVADVAVTCVTNQYQIGGTISGLVGTGLELSCSGEPNQQIAAGATSFQFQGPLDANTAYDVEVASQPQSPFQTCSVGNGRGTLVTNVANIAVTCVTNQYRVGGTITGLTGTGLVLTAAGLPSLSVAAGATSFVFAQTLGSGSSFSVAVATQPNSPNQVCSVTNGSGTVANGDIGTIAISCSPIPNLTGVWVGATASSAAGTFGSLPITIDLLDDAGTVAGHYIATNDAGANAFGTLFGSITGNKVQMQLASLTPACSGSLSGMGTISLGPPLTVAYMVSGATQCAGNNTLSGEVSRVELPSGSVPTSNVAGLWLGTIFSGLTGDGMVSLLLVDNAGAIAGDIMGNTQGWPTYNPADGGTTVGPAGLILGTIQGQIINGQVIGDGGVIQLTVTSLVPFCPATLRGYASSDAGAQSLSYTYSGVTYCAGTDVGFGTIFQQ